jgi:hypothetical protein
MLCRAAFFLARFCLDLRARVDEAWGNPRDGDVLSQITPPRWRCLYGRTSARAYNFGKTCLQKKDQSHQCVKKKKPATVVVAFKEKLRRRAASSRCSPAARLWEKKVFKSSMSIFACACNHNHNHHHHSPSPVHQSNQIKITNHQSPITISRSPHKSQISIWNFPARWKNWKSTMNNE